MFDKLYDLEAKVSSDMDQKGSAVMMIKIYTRLDITDNLPNQDSVRCQTTAGRCKHIQLLILKISK